MDLVAPSAVVDFGCGEGVWLRHFADAGVTRILGFDGAGARPGLAIPSDCFVETDLDRSMPSVNKPADLAVCLEVGEHLPAARAGALVSALVSAAPVVLFSAAIPGQPGTNHINCQWPEYWAELFAGHRYQAVDCIRPKVWGNSEVMFYYQQNTVLYLGPGRTLPDGVAPGVPVRMVHPATYDLVLYRLEHSVPRSTAALSAALCLQAPQTAWRLLNAAAGKAKSRLRRR